MLHADYVESGTYPIIMANEFGGVIFHEACGHLLETTQIERKTSPLREKGEKLPESLRQLGMKDSLQLPSGQLTWMMRVCLPKNAVN